MIFKSGFTKTIKHLGIFNLAMLFFVFYGIILRFIYLGKNDFIGDEVNTLEYLPGISRPYIGFIDFVNFLLLKNRGPGQYFVNYLNTSIFGFINEFQIRFPFFLISILSFVPLYLFALKIFKSKKIALVSVVLFSINGLFVVFGRLAQYQSFIIFLIPLSAMFYIEGIKTKRLMLLFLASLLFSFSALFHYDGLSAAIFFVALPLKIFFDKKIKIKFLAKSQVLFWGIFGLINLLFYIPFILNSYYSQKTSTYLSSRIFGGGFMPKTPYFELGLILELYLPIFFWFVMFFLSSFSFVVLQKHLNKIDLKIVVLKKHVVLITYLFFIFLFNSAFILSTLELKPRLSTLLIYFSSISICFILLLNKKVRSEIFALICWFLISFDIYFFFMKDPRTHIYVVLIPGFILTAFTIYKLITYKKQFIRVLAHSTFFIFLLLISYFDYLVFIQKDPEYLWEKKYFFGIELPNVLRTQKTSRKIFGFGSNNHFLSVASMFKSRCLTGDYFTNEKLSVSKFYLEKEPVSLYDTPENLVYFVYPSTWSRVEKPMLDSLIEYRILKVYYNNGKPVTYIYGRRDTYALANFSCIGN